MAGLYIHIPFCKSRCIYCGFYSTTEFSVQDKYVDALCKEMDLRKEGGLPEAGEDAESGCQSQAISTIYIGGGTPSQLSSENLRRLFLYIYKVYDVADDAEITVECNPDDVTEGYADVMRELHVNRVSMGAQTFDDGRLRFIHRRHTSGQVPAAVEKMRNAGISNISIDLMFGFPGETIDEWRKDIDCAIHLDVEHVSAYSLMFEEGTPLFRMMREGTVREIDEELSLQMYEELIDRMESAGYEHYEISNFARPGRRSRHNSSYWHGVPYIGIGAAAHSFDIDSRQWNVSDVDEYIRSINRGVIPMEREILDVSTKYDDTVMTSLRTCEGVDIEKIKNVFGIKYSDYLVRNARKYVDARLLNNDGGRLCLTRKGLFVSDGIMSDLMYV